MKRACLVVTFVVFLAGVCSAQSPRQVEVVAEVSLTNQTGTTNGTLFTAAQTGLFRVSYMIQCTNGDARNGHGLTPTLSWTDDNGSDGFIPGSPINDNVPQRPITYVFVFKDIGGAPIEWQVTTVPEDKSVYEVYIALERLGPMVH